MGLPWELLLLTPLVFGMLSNAPAPPSSGHKGEDVPHHFPITVHNEATVNNSLEELRRRYLDEKNKLKQCDADHNNTCSVWYVRLDELQRDIAAMESDLKARYLLFYKIMRSFNYPKRNVQSYGEAYSILVSTLHELPETSRKILSEYLNFSERPAKVGVDDNATSSDGDGKKNAAILSDTPKDKDEEMEKASLKIIEDSLVVANNALPNKVRETREPLTLAIQIIRMMLKGPVQLSLSDLDPFFMAVSKTARFMIEKWGSYSTDKIEFPLSALYDALKELCSLAAKLDVQGELLKSYFERRLGDAWKNLNVNSAFSLIGDVAGAVNSL